MFKSDKRQTKFKLVIKRFIDILLAGTFLIFALPILLITAIVIKVNSKGPIIFKQIRVGKGKKRFTFYKLRSMYVGSKEEIHKEYIRKLMSLDYVEKGRKKAIYKLTNDPRITSIGRFIRKTSIDELPQLFNVLKGDMSLVGPRPAIPYELEYHDKEMMKRFSVKPGITGLWQVSGRSMLTFKQMVKMDIFYIERWSIWLDIKILLKTVLHVLNLSYAY